MALSIKDRDLYHRIGRGEMTNQAFLDHLLETGFLAKVDTNSEWWAVVLSLANKRRTGEDLPDLIAQSGVFEGDDPVELIGAKIVELGGPQGFDLHFTNRREDSVFQKIYQTVESLGRFERP